MPKYNNLNVKRVNINLPIQLIDRVQEYSSSLGIPYTQGYTILLQQALQQQDNLKVMNDFNESVKIVSKLSEEDRKKLSYMVGPLGNR